MPSYETAGGSLKVEPIITPVHSDVEIETAIMALRREPRGGLVVHPDVFMNVHRAPIISAAARNNVPAVYFVSTFPQDGGLLSSGPHPVDTFRPPASYLHPLPRRGNPAELPVQLRANFEMALNLK